MEGFIIILVLLGFWLAYCIQEIIRLKAKVEALEIGLKRYRLELKTDINRVEKDLQRHVHVKLHGAPIGPQEK